MTSTALSTASDRSAAIEGLEDLGAGDFILPRYSLVQPTSRKEGADGHTGQFIRNIDNAFSPHLDVVILKISPSRLLWSGDQSDKKPECFSRDGRHGSVYGACASCDFNPQFNGALWAERGTNVKICNYGYTLLLAGEDGTLALLGAMGTSVRPIKTLNATFAAKKRSPFSALVRFESEKVTNDRGKFYVLHPVVRDWFDESTTARWRDEYLAMKSATIRDVGDDEPTLSVPDEEPNF